MVPRGLPRGCGGGRALASWGSGKHGFAWEWFSNLRLGDSPRPKWIVWYPGGLWESQFAPKPFKKAFSRLFPVFGKFGEVPPGPLCISYGPFEGLAILSSYLVDPSLLYFKGQLTTWEEAAGHPRHKSDGYNGGVENRA